MKNLKCVYYELISCPPKCQLKLYITEPMMDVLLCVCVGLSDSNRAPDQCKSWCCHCARDSASTQILHSEWKWRRRQSEGGDRTRELGCGRHAYDKMIVVAPFEATACAWMVGCISRFVGNPCSELLTSRVGEPRAKVGKKLPQRLQGMGGGK